MNCREFKSKHVAFVDDLLSAADMADMTRHLRICARCSSLDVRIRRSLMIVRNLPQIEPSADFYARLSERLKTAPSPSSSDRFASVATTAIVATAALAAAIYFAMAVQVQRKAPAAPISAPAVAIAPQPQTQPAEPINDANVATTVSAGVPVWPAMFMVGELPMHLANSDLGESSAIGR
jgi:hypothetical protein